MSKRFKRIAQLFSLRGEVNRVTYLCTGVALMALKYLVEAGLILRVTGKSFTVRDFLNPWMSAREQFLDGAPEWFGTAWAIWTVPFVWIALAMTAQRCRDAGRSQWGALTIFVPLLNLAMMLFYAYLPSKQSDSHPSSIPRKDPIAFETPSAFAAACSGSAIGFVYVFGLTLISVYVAGSYGATLFFGTPIVSGAAAAYLYNRIQKRGWTETIVVAYLPVFLMLLAMMIFALEGVVCLVMVMPLALPLCLLGALLGKQIAEGTRPRQADDYHLLGCLMILPLLGGLETLTPRAQELVVTTSVDIEATPAEVWDRVVDFPPITTPDPWYFRLGIASPREATIDGHGVGATRYCKFTTGEFVEPITVWDEPRRLAFDVTDQPDPMTELTPYRHVHPPHLDGVFLSTRGEFRLVELPDGNTRLEGRTWYTLDVRPLGYWTVWTDAIVHRIHLRVLEHIKQLAEAESDR